MFKGPRTLWIPFLVFVLVGGAFLVAWLGFQHHERQILNEHSEVISDQAAIRLESFLHTRLRMVDQMRVEWYQGHINDPDEFEKLALAVQAQFGSFQAINYIDPEGVIRWVVPEESNLPARGSNLREHPLSGPVLAEVDRNGKPLLSPPLNLIQGGRGFASYFPLSGGTRIEGYLNGVFRIGPVVRDGISQGITNEYYLRIIDGGEVLYRDGPERIFDQSKLTKERLVHILNRPWRIQFTPKPSLVARYQSHLDDALLILTLLLTAALAGTIYFDLKNRQELKASEERLRLAIEYMPVMVSAYSEDRQLIVWNHRSEQVSGYSAEEMIHRPDALAILFPNEEDRRRFELTWFDEPEIRAGECQLTSKDGSTRIVQWFKGPHDLTIPGWTFWGTGIDITDRRKTEDALRITQFSVDHSAVPTFWVHPNGSFFYINQAACDSLGYCREELLDMQVRDIDPLFPPTDWQQQLSDLKRHRMSIIETVHRRKDGETFPVEITANYLEYKGVVYIFAFAVDITERKKAEAERRRMERNLLETQKLESLGLLAGGIAHDFNNLLTAMMGSASLAKEIIEQDHPVREHLDLVEAAAQQAADLARQLLAYSGKGKFMVSRIDLNRIIRETAQLLRISIAKGIKMVFDLADAPVLIEADITQIRQIVMNLVVNAAESIGEAGGEITIRTVLGEISPAALSHAVCAPETVQKRYALLEVADNGGGMDEQTKANIFEPFYSTKAKGRGLGLAAVVGIVRGHQGILTVDSERGRGTTFQIWLPAAEGPAANEAAQPAGRSASPPGTILVVDDETSVRFVARAILEDSGYQVLEAEDGVEAVEQFRAHAEEISAVLLDITMPRMNGQEAFEQIRQIRSDVPVVLSSGYDEHESMPKLINQAELLFIQKPYRADQLLSAIEQAVQG